MPLPIDVSPYELMGVTGGDNYLTHYKARNDKGEDFTITEFFPTYMVKRDDDGTLEVSERFSKEFLSDREDFIKRAEGFQEIRDASLHPVVEIFERNHTAYIVRRSCGMTTIDQYMGSQTMDYDEAYYFMRPLLLSMSQVAESGTIFNISMGDFRVNTFKQLVLAAPPAWDKNFHPALTQIVKLYYRLVTGMEAPAQNPPAFSAYGISIPPRIEALMMEILNGDILYGSLDDFYKKMKSLIDGTSENDKGASKRTLAVMRGIVAALFVTFAFSLILLVFGAVRAYRVNFFWANPEVFADAEASPPPEYDFSNITITHPRNSADALIGSFAAHDGFLFFRGENGMMSRRYAETVFIPGAMGLTALAEDRLIVPGASPAFIAGNGRRSIYFVDSTAGGVIYRATATGEDITRITEHAALNLAVIDDFLFYTHVDQNHHLYRLNLETYEHELILARPVNAVINYGSYLFFIAEEDSSNPTALYAWNTEENTLRRISTTARGGLRTFGDTLFYIDVYGRIRSIAFDGRPIAIHPPENVHSFDVFFQWIVFTEDGRHVPRVYNMNNGEFYTLSTTEWVSYIWTHDSLIYALDHRNPALVHTFNFP
ncbi:MAG: DUF5050 domain-containing protein [Defluviitaleaceae bacterium]|nr:DUF5050 domain-containing protein [Defluviitaleaceae bacterium]